MTAQRVAELAPFVGIVARERASLADRSDLYDDLRQEGLIRAWTVLQERPDAPREYMIAVVKRGVADLIRGRRPFGAPSRQGRVDASDTTLPLVRTSADGGEEFTFEPEDPTGQDGVELLGAREAVQRAVAALEPADRALVFGRYWRDLSFAELAPELGRPTGTLSRRWISVIRPQLRAALEGV